MQPFICSVSALSIRNFPGAPMKKFLLAICFLLAIAVTASAQTLSVIRAGSLIDGQSPSPKKNQLIFIRGDKIEKITDASQSIPSDAKLIDLSGSTVLPGLIDSHTHIFLWAETPDKCG